MTHLPGRTSCQEQARGHRDGQWDVGQVGAVSHCPCWTTRHLCSQELGLSVLPGEQAAWAVILPQNALPGSNGKLHHGLLNMKPLSHKSCPSRKCQTIYTLPCKSHSRPLAVSFAF